MTPEVLRHAKAQSACCAPRQLWLWLVLIASLITAISNLQTLLLCMSAAASIQCDSWQ